MGFISLWGRKIKSFFAIPAGVKALLFEAYFTALYVKLALLFFPFARVAKWLGAPQADPLDEISPLGVAQAKKIMFALKLCERYTPWHLECYTLSVTGKILLNRRKQKGILYFGFLKEPNGKLKGHAWLKTNSVIVTGGEVHAAYQVHSAFV